MALDVIGGTDRLNEREQDRGSQQVHVIVKAAHEELCRLIQERALITKRIGTIKQTIVGLGNLFGDDELSAELGGVVHRKTGVRRSGLTPACRMVLMGARAPMSAREVCEQVQQRIMPGMPSPRNLAASVTTILNRLVEYGEAHAILGADGRRAWTWESEAGDRTATSASNAEHLASRT
jgi:hypothetical protein